MSSIEPIVPMRASRSEKGSERRRALRFGLLMGAVLGGAGTWVLVRRGPAATGWALVGLALAFVLYAMVHPAGALVLRAAWVRFGAAIGRVNSVILLSALYFVLVTPLGILARLVGRRSFRRTPQASYFTERAERRDRKRFEHPY
jgi:hypothetical protein